MHTTTARAPSDVNLVIYVDHAGAGQNGSGGTTTSRERVTNIFMSVVVYIFIQKTSSKSKSSDCSELDSEIILSERRIVGALEGTRLELGVRLVTLQLYTYWYNTVVHNFKNYRCWSVERRQVP